MLPSYDMDTFFAVASPTTLASLIADIGELDDADDAEIELSSAARDNLEANVGEEECTRLIDAAANIT